MQPLFETVKKPVIASQRARYYALRAAFGGCALYRPAGLVAWQSVL